MKQEREIIGSFDRKGRVLTAGMNDNGDNQRCSMMLMLAPRPNESYMAFMERVLDDSRKRGFTEQEAKMRMQVYNQMNARRIW